MIQIWHKISDKVMERCYVPRPFFAGEIRLITPFNCRSCSATATRDLLRPSRRTRAARRMTIFTFPSSHLAVKLETLGVKKANMRLNFLGKIFYLGEKPYLEGKLCLPAITGCMQYLTYGEIL